MLVLKLQFSNILSCGVADKSVGSVFYGEVGIFVELPKADEIEDYEQYVNLN